MKHKDRILLAFLASTALFSLLPTTTYAASTDECAIWLCLPGGWPDGCGDAARAMRDRIASFKPPLPPLPSCWTETNTPAGGTIRPRYGNAALIGELRECVEWDDSVNPDSDYQPCRRWEVTEPAYYMKDRICKINSAEQTRNPPRCVATHQYLDVYVNGEKKGPTEYFHF